LGGHFGVVSDGRHSIETDNLERSLVSGKDLVPFLPSICVTNALQRSSILGAHDYSGSSLIKRIVISSLTKVRIV